MLAQAHGLPVSFVLSVAQRRAAGEYAYAPPAALQEIDRLLQANGGVAGSLRIEVVEQFAPGELKALGPPLAQSDHVTDSTSQSWSASNGSHADVEHAVNGHASTNGHPLTNGHAGVNRQASVVGDLPAEAVESAVEPSSPPHIPGTDEASRVRVTAIICSDEIAQAVRESPNRGRPFPVHEPVPVHHLVVPDGLRCAVEIDLLPGQIVTVEVMEAADRRVYDKKVNAWASDSASRASVSELPTPPPSRTISYLLTTDRRLVHADGSRRTRELLDEYLYGGVVELGDLAREVQRRSARRGSPRCHQAEIIT
jgi:hypothetical protein